MQTIIPHSERLDAEEIRYASQLWEKYNHFIRIRVSLLLYLWLSLFELIKAFNVTALLHKLKKVKKKWGFNENPKWFNFDDVARFGRKYTCYAASSLFYLLKRDWSVFDKSAYQYSYASRFFWILVFIEMIEAEEFVQLVLEAGKKEITCGGLGIIFFYANLSMLDDRYLFNSLSVITSSSSFERSPSICFL